MQNARSQKSRYYPDKINNEKTITKIKPGKKLRNPDSYLTIAKQKKNKSKTQPKYEYNFLTNTHSLSMSPQILLDYRKSELCKQINQSKLSCKCKCHYCRHYHCYCHFIEKNSTSLRSQSTILNRTIKKNITSPNNNKSSKKNVKNKSNKKPKSCDKNIENFKDNENKKQINYPSNDNTLKPREPFKMTNDINNRKESDLNSVNPQKFYNTTNNFRIDNTLYNNRYDYNPNTKYSLKNSYDNLNENINFYNYDNINNDMKVNNYDNIYRDCNVNNYDITQPSNFNNNMKIYESNTFNKLTYSCNYNEPYLTYNKLLFNRTQPISGIRSQSYSNRYNPIYNSNSFYKSLNENCKTCDHLNQIYKIKAVNSINNYINNTNYAKNGENNKYDIMFDKCERKIRKLIGQLPNNKNKRTMLRNMYSDINIPRHNKVIETNSFRRSELLKLNRF